MNNWLWVAVFAPTLALANNWLWVAVFAPTLALASTTAARWLGRWFTKAIKSELVDAVSEIVKPDLDGLAVQLDKLRADGVLTGADVSARIVGLEVRVDRIEKHLNLTPTEGN